MTYKSFEEKSTNFALNSPFGENSVFHPNFYKNQREEKNNLIPIENIDSINQTLVKGKNNSANGYYFLNDGTFLGNYGTSQNIVICDKKNTKYKDNNDKIGWNEFSNPQRLDIFNEDFIHFSGAVYGESVQGFGINIKEEIFAFATAIGNYKKKSKKNMSYRQALNENNVYAIGEKNYNNFIKEDRNKFKEMKLAIASVINEILNGFDYSYGATSWDGIDIKTSKWAKGLKFTKEEHDIFGLGNNLIEGVEYWKYPTKKDNNKYIRRKWDSKYVTTIAYSGENLKMKNRNYPYFKNDKQNMNRFGTTFTKINPDFEKVIPSKTLVNENK